jgi:hypothetical protein
MTKKTKSHRPTLDSILRPLKMTCANCKGEMTVYPYPNPTGTGYCPNCSPAWLQSFVKFGMNQERIKHGLEPIEEVK